MDQLLERDDELDRLARRWRATAGTGSLVLVEGAAGMGKSTLLARTRADAAAADLRVLRARGAELEREFPLRRRPPAPGAPAAERRRRSPSARSCRARRSAPPTLLGFPGAATRAGAGRRPTGLRGPPRPLLAVREPRRGPAAARGRDDAHWADASSLRFLASCAAARGAADRDGPRRRAPARPGPPASSPRCCAGDAQAATCARPPSARPPSGASSPAGSRARPRPQFVAAAARRPAGRRSSPSSSLTRCARTRASSRPPPRRRGWRSSARGRSPAGCSRDSAGCPRPRERWPGPSRCSSTAEPRHAAALADLDRRRRRRPPTTSSAPGSSTPGGP